jgi:hypothetical protein
VPDNDHLRQKHVICAKAARERELIAWPFTQQTFYQTPLRQPVKAVSIAFQKLYLEKNYCNCAL